MTVFINEIHYDNTGGDTGEFIEVAGLAGTDLTGWSLALYNGSNGTLYDTVTLSGVLGDTANGYGFAAFAAPGLQNGAPDGIALVDAGGTVVEFLSYEGSFTAVGGPADGMTSTDIGVSEPSDTPVGFSLQLGGTGAPGTFTWAAPQAETPGAVNTGQVFGAPEPGRIVISEIMYNPASAEDDWEWVEITNTGGTTVDLAGYVIDDVNSLFQSGANIAAGSVAPGESAVLFNADDITAADFEAAWGTGLNLVAVTNWGAMGLNNGGDTVAIWDSFAAYAGDELTGANAVDAVAYDDSFPWPSDDGAGSIYLADLALSNDDGSNWVLSAAGGGTPTGEVRLSAANAGNSGADLGSPGGDPDTPAPQFVKIHEIQGSSDFSGIDGLAEVEVDDVTPLLGAFVTVEAIVTADFQDGLGGFFLQEEDADWDADAYTSEGLFVFSRGTSLGDVSVGDKVMVTGFAGEFRGQTQISASFIETISTDNILPSATEVYFPSAGLMRDESGGLVADLEAYEGMRIAIPEDMTVTEMFNLDRFGEYKVSSEGRLEQFTEGNAPSVEGYAAHLEDIAGRSLTIDDGRSVQNPLEVPIVDGNNGVLDADDSFRMGDTLANLTGVLGYGFDEFRLQTPTGDYTAENPRPDTPEDVGGTLKVASLNVLNYFTTIDTGADNGGPDDDQEPRGADSVEEFERQANKLVTAIAEMDADILGLVELENDDDIAIADLVARVNDRLGAEVYDYIATGDFGTDAITVGIIYKPDAVEPVGDFAGLFEFEGRDFIDPLNSGRELNRPALAQTFLDLDSGQEMTVVVNHLKSKGSLSGLAEDEDQGDGQGNNNASRTEAADILADWLATNPTGAAGGNTNTLVLGDLNAYGMEDPITLLKAAGYVDIADALIGDDAYSFVFDGQVGSLDYALSNMILSNYLAGATDWHINADEADAIDYDLSFGRNPDWYNGDTPARNSDHDPIIVGFDFAPIVIGTRKSEKLDGTMRGEVMDAGEGNDKYLGLDGADIFVAGAGDTDKVRDFEDGLDRIDLRDWGVVELEDLWIKAAGKGVRIRDIDSKAKMFIKSGPGDRLLTDDLTAVLGDLEGAGIEPGDRLLTDDLTEDDFIFAPDPGLLV